MLNAQANMARITGWANAVLIAATGLTLVLMIWLAADGVGDRAPGPLIAMVAFTTMASFELMMPITAAFQYLGKTLTAAKRSTPSQNAHPVFLSLSMATKDR